MDRNALNMRVPKRDYMKILLLYCVIIDQKPNLVHILMSFSLLFIYK